MRQRTFLLAPGAERQRDLELAVRSVACPVCDAKPGAACRYTERPEYRTFHPAAAKGFAGRIAHTGRYDVAVVAGLVPAMPGVRPPAACLYCGKSDCTERETHDQWHRASETTWWRAAHAAAS